MRRRKAKNEWNKKARVKGTNNIIDVEFDKGAFNEGYPPYWEKENNMFYQPEQLEWVDNEENAEPDYWTRLEHQAAIAAMQGILSNQDYCKLLIDENNKGSFAEDVSRCASDFAHFLVGKMKEVK